MTLSVSSTVLNNSVPNITLTPPLASRKRIKKVRSVRPREDELIKSPLRIQLPCPLPSMPQPALMLSSRHALTYAVAAPARSGFPSAQVVPRQRLSICGTERQDILFHKNSCEPIVVEARKGTSSGPLLPQKRGASVISPPAPPPCMHLLCSYRTRM